MSHTPGPWHWRRTTFDNVVTLEPRVIRIDGYDGSIEIANLKDGFLIEAAPDLLAALQELTAEYVAAVEQTFEPKYHKFIEANTALKMARAAIAKATGAA